MPIFRLGVVGYSSQRFDIDRARPLLRAEIGALTLTAPDAEVVSGLTALGIPLVAYEVARECGLVTVGVACEKAKDYPCFPCDEVVIVGSEWGDESETFLGRIDFLLKVGGGKQSAAEFERFPGPKKEVNLPTLA